MKTLKEAKQHATDLTSNATERLLLWDKMDEMINMDWQDKPKLENDPNIKFTTSPQARNTFLGAKRLLTATNPIIKIPRSRNAEAIKENLDNIENMLKAIWELSGKFAGRPVHYDLVDQLLRYDECQLAITDTKDLYIFTRMVARQRSCAISDWQNRHPTSFSRSMPAMDGGKRMALGSLLTFAGASSHTNRLLHALARKQLMVQVSKSRITTPLFGTVTIGIWMSTSPG